MKMAAKAKQGESCGISGEMARRNRAAQRGENRARAARIDRRQRARRGGSGIEENVSIVKINNIESIKYGVSRRNESQRRKWRERIFIWRRNVKWRRKKQ
jgi:hypothetical protein